MKIVTKSITIWTEPGDIVVTRTRWYFLGILIWKRKVRQIASEDDPLSRAWERGH